MKHLLTLAILLVFTNEVSAQKPWKWTQLNGPNVGSKNFTLMFDENNNIIAVGPLGYYLSLNNGKTWDYHSVIAQKGTPCSTQYYGTPYDGKYSGLFIFPSGEYFFYFRSCDYRDSNIVGVYRSTDKGNTWVHVLKGYNGLQMITGQNNSLILFASTIQRRLSLFESIDKGNSWTEIYEPQEFNFEIVGSNEKYLYALLNTYSLGGGSLSRMSYADLKWMDYNPTIAYSSISSFSQLNNNLFMSSAGDSIFISDGENNWKSVGSTTGSIALTRGLGDTTYSTQVSLDLTKLRISFTIDQGKTWNNFASITPFNYFYSSWALNCQNSDRLLFENDTALYLSVDRGNSWTEIGLPADSINKILLTNSGKIFAEDAPNSGNNYPPYRNMSISEDKGQTWHKSKPDNVQIDGIGKGLNGSIIAVAPESSSPYTNNIWIYDSTIPTEWKRASVVEYISSYPLIATDGSKYIYIASGNVIFRSDDNAFKWLDMNAPKTANNIYSLDVAADGIVYIGSYPSMYRSDDYGTTWTELNPVNDIAKLTFIKTFGTSGVLLGTEGDGLLISNDKGNSWSRLDGKNFDTVTCIAINNKGEIAAGTNRGLWISDTSKRNWSKVTLGHEANLYIGGIDVAQNDDFYVGTYGASVWKGTRNYNSVKYSSEDHSAMQISPNPTTGKITITLDVASEEQIRLELYDILGRRISVLADGRYSGENHITFNTSDLSNGIYTLILSGAENETQKIVVQH